MTYILLLVGLAILIKGADWLVTGASSVAARAGITPLVIGLTIVAFGTSAPELAVSVTASLSGSNDLAIGNILGSNIANILLILGLAAVISPLVVQRTTVWKEIPFALLAIIAVGILSQDVLLDGGSASVLTRSDGLVLISFFVIFLYYVIELARSSRNEVADEPHRYGYPRSFFMITAGLMGLVIGGNWIVAGAVALANAVGMSEALVGLTIVAVGTSLPELATSIVAAKKGKADIAVGNIVGSNIFNVFWILGASAFITPLPFAEPLLMDLWMALLATLLLFFALFIGKKHTIDRWQGILFVLIYLVYLAYIISRG